MQADAGGAQHTPPVEGVGAGAGDDESAAALAAGVHQMRKVISMVCRHTATAFPHNISRQHHSFILQVGELR
jgi:hypothetical protein